MVTITNQILQAIVQLVPTAKCSVWSDVAGYTSSTSPIIIEYQGHEYAIDWHSANTEPCPTQEEIITILEAN